MKFDKIILNEYTYKDYNIQVYNEVFISDSGQQHITPEIFNSIYIDDYEIAVIEKVNENNFILYIFKYPDEHADPTLSTCVGWYETFDDAFEVFRKHDAERRFWKLMK